MPPARRGYLNGRPSPLPSLVDRASIPASAFMKLPDRPGPYIMTLLLLILVALAAYISLTVTSPELNEAIEHAKARKATQTEAR